MLKDLLNDLSEATGIQVTSANTRAQLLRYINVALKEIWARNDLPDSCDEFKMDLTTADRNTLIVLPWQAASVRGVKWEYGQTVALRNVGQEYSDSALQSTAEWRVIRRVSLYAPLPQNTQLTFTLGQVEDAPVTISVTGQTNIGQRVTEEVTIVPGELSATTLNQWSGEAPERIAKSDITKSDVIITQAGTANQLGIIANFLQIASHILLAVTTEFTSQPGGRFNVLYKKHCPELYYDTDGLSIPQLELALRWKALANFYGKAPDATNSYMVAAATAKQVLSDICKNQDSETQNLLKFGENKFAFHKVMLSAKHARRGSRMYY